MIYHHNALPVSKSSFCKSDWRTTVARSLSKGGLVTFDYIFVWQITKSSFSSEVFLPSTLSIWSWLDIGSKVTVDKPMWTMMALLISQHPNLSVYQPLCRFPGEAGDYLRFFKPVIPSAEHSWVTTGTSSHRSDWGSNHPQTITTSSPVGKLTIFRVTPFMGAKHRVRSRAHLRS